MAGSATGHSGNQDFLLKGIWEIERNSQPDDLGSSSTLATSFLHHHGQTTLPLRISSPFLWNEWMGTGLKDLLQLRHPVTILRVTFHPFLRDTFLSFSVLNHFFHWTAWYSRMISGIRLSWAQNQPSSHSLAEWSWANLYCLISKIRIGEPCRATGRNTLNNLKEEKDDSLLVGLLSGNTTTTSSTSFCIVVHTQSLCLA